MGSVTLCYLPPGGGSTERERIAAQFLITATDDYTYGEKQSRQAFEALVNFTDLPFVVKTLRKVAADDYTYGEWSQLKAMEILARAFGRP